MRGIFFWIIISKRIRTSGILCSHVWGSGWSLHFLSGVTGQAFQTTLEDFWTAFQEWAKAPDDSVQQNLVIQKANLFVSRSNAVYTGLSDYQSTINTQISDDIDRINELGNTIFKLNLEIQKVESGNVETAMTLRDERDNALDELASYVDISYKRILMEL